VVEPGPKLSVVQQASVACDDGVGPSDHRGSEDGRVAGVPRRHGDLDSGKEDVEKEADVADVSDAEGE
jgi:hypothetical protein